MTTPPAESVPSGNPSQPSVPPQPLPPTPTKGSTKPTQSASRKPRQRKRADVQDKQQQQQPAAQATTITTTPPIVQPQGAPAYHPPPRGPIFQPYPGPPYHMMNPPYSMNGPPYGQHPQPPPQHGQPMNQSVPPPPPQYGYPMHPGAYPHAYPPYPQYPQPMMMYSTPRQEGPPDPPSHVVESSEPVSNTGTKRKRKSMSQGGRDQGAEKGSDEDAASGNDVSRPAATQPTLQTSSSVDLKKRTKTQRACDSCRSRKIRCDIIPDADPPICQHCKQYGFECTFFLPITETRFKKKKLEDETEKEKMTSTGAESGKAAARDLKRDVGVFGPTSATHLLHSQATINPRVYENYDLRYHHSFEVSKGGDGLILLQKPADENQPNLPQPSDLNIERDVVEKLVNAYFSDIAPLLPIVTEAEFLALSNPPSILIYSICLVAAAQRNVRHNVFDSIRYIVNSLLKAEDVLSTASIVNVQSLLILCMTGDCHSPFVPNAISALWIRLGAAIRMAQDLGLHRAEAVKQDIELRRRLWAACLICDRWAAIAYGFPYMIDVQDCDARLPSAGDSTALYMDELVRLSILLGRVQKTIYSPSGITFATDEVLHGLLSDLKRWKEALPGHLKFRGAVESPLTAGLLHLLYSCVCMMFWRVFMKISYSCPAHLKFAMNVEQWTELVNLTSECIDWLDAHERIYDTWLIVAYAATSCALVQYHTFVRRKDPLAQAKLLKLRDCVRRWEAAISPDHMSTRRKTAEIISLLYEAAQGPQVPLQTPVLNPTGGVKSKQPVVLDYKQDPSRPGGGIFVAQSKVPELKDLPKGVVIRSEDEIGDTEGEDALPAATAAASSVSLLALNSNNDQVRAALPSSRVSSSATPAVPKTTRQLALPPDAFEQSMFTVPSPVVNYTGSSATPPSLTGGQAGMVSNLATMVKVTPLTVAGRASKMNVNPVMNQTESSYGNVQVMNVLDEVANGTNLANFQMADNGFLEGLPGGMFDWGQWDTFFSRFGVASQIGNGNVHKKSDN